MPTDGGFGHISNFQNHSPTNISNTNLTHQGANIRNSFNNDHINNYTVNHYGNNYGHWGGYGGWGHGYGWGGWGYPGGFWGWPGGWWCPGWSEGAAWTFLGVSTLLPFLGLAMSGGGGGGGSHKSTPPQNVTYTNNNVYVNGQPAGNVQQYYQQAEQLADQGLQQPPPSYTQQQYATTSSYDPSLQQAGAMQQQQPDQSDQWQALGVFGLAEPGQTQSNMLLQLAINKQGVIRGNYMNELTNEKSQVFGALDKNTQRISWTIGQNNSTVFDTSLGALVQQDSQVLVHYGPDNTQEMALIRLDQPASPPSGNSPDSANQAPQPAPNYTPYG
jgi:hypothetical protein